MTFDFKLIGESILRHIREIYEYMPLWYDQLEKNKFLLDTTQLPLKHLHHHREFLDTVCWKNDNGTQVIAVAVTHIYSIESATALFARHLPIQFIQG